MKRKVFARHQRCDENIRKRVTGVEKISIEILQL